MPALRSAEPDTTVIADGFSCRTQITHLARDRAPRHTAEVLAENLTIDDTGRPVATGRRMAVAVAVATGGALLAARRRRRAT